MQDVFKVTKTILSTASITDDETGDAFSMQDFTGMFVRTTHTGTLAGPVLLQGSDASDGTFTTLLDSAGDPITLATLAGATATFTQTVDAVFAPWCRVFYDDTSGTGTIVCVATLVRQA